VGATDNVQQELKTVRERELALAKEIAGLHENEMVMKRLHQDDLERLQVSSYTLSDACMSLASNSTVVNGCFFVSRRNFLSHNRPRRRITWRSSRRSC
jgi:hypothetical protein